MGVSTQSHTHTHTHTHVSLCMSMKKFLCVLTCLARKHPQFEMTLEELAEKYPQQPFGVPHIVSCTVNYLEQYGTFQMRLLSTPLFLIALNTSVKVSTLPNPYATHTSCAFHHIATFSSIPALTYLYTTDTYTLTHTHTHTHTQIFFLSHPLPLFHSLYLPRSYSPTLSYTFLHTHAVSHLCSTIPPSLFGLSVLVFSFWLQPMCVCVCVCVCGV